MSFQNKTVIITGGASGMGRRSAECYTAEGANVVLADINEAALIELCAEINAKGKGKAIYSVCDVRVYDQVQKTADLAVETFGSIDILLNFAGGFELRMCNCDKPFPETPIEVFDWGIDVNLKGPYYFARAVCPQMVKQHSGVIINLGSVTGAEGSPAGMAYPSAKAGIMTGLTKSIAQFGFDHNIRCVCVSPGPVMTRPAMANMKTGLGRVAETQEVVDFIMYLTSEKAAAITGSNHFIDCGRETLPHR